MTTVLVTGGTGALGRQVVTKLVEAGYTARIMSRSAVPARLLPGREWAQADVESGLRLAEAVQGVDVIVHAATSPLKHTYQVDVEGTRRLLEQARAASVAHFVYISIVGMERIPFPYYRYKLAAEDLVKDSDLPWSILRAAQFHSFFDRLFETLVKVPLVMPLPAGLKGQPIADSEVADRLCALVAGGPSGRVPDFYGPQVSTWDGLAKSWLLLRGLHRSLIRLPLPGKVAQGFRRGYTTCPDCPESERGTITWSAWLNQRYGLSQRTAGDGGGNEGKPARS